LQHTTPFSSSFAPPFDVATRCSILASPVGMVSPQKKQRLPCKKSKRSSCFIPVAGRRLMFDMSGVRRREKPAEACPLDGKGLNVIALQDGAFLVVGKDLLGHVVDHHGTFEVGYGWISAVLLSDE